MVRSLRETSLLILLSLPLVLVCSLDAFSASTPASEPSNSYPSQAEFYAFVGGMSKTDLLSPAQQEVIVPLMIDNRPLGDINALIGSGLDSSNIATKTLIELLEPFVSVGLLKRLKKQLLLTSRLNFAKLRQLGIYLIFDSKKVLLRVDLDPMIRKIQRHNLQTRPLQQKDDPSIIPNAQFSGGLDYFISGSWLNGKRQAFNLGLDSHLDFDGWLLQNRHSYREQQASPWQRQQTLLTRDWPNQLTRFSAGDLNNPRIGFMSNPPISGVSFGTFFELQPLQINYPLSNEDFFLEQDARVEVFIDGQLRGRRNLSAGQHNIYDMPLINGVNQVELRITDLLGRQQSLRFFETQDQRLLMPGTKNYSITFGVPRKTGLDGIEYQVNNKIISAFYRYGWSEELTVGGWLELDKNLRGLGITGITSQIFGAFTGELALSNDNREQGGVSPAIRLGYRYRTRHWSFDSEWSWQHKFYSTLSQTPSDNNTHHQARIGLTIPRLFQWTANFSLSHSRRWQGKSRFSKRLTLSRQFTQDWRLSANFSHFNAQTDQESFIGIQLYWSPSMSRHQANTNYNSDKNSTRAEYNYRRNSELGMDFRAGLSDNDQGQQQRLDVNYLSSQFDSRLTLNHYTPIEGDVKQTKRVRLGSAVAFADGHWATSRPLRGQPFALITSQKSLAKAKIGIVRGSGLHSSAFLDGAEDTTIMPNLSPYYVNQLNLDLQDLPIEMQIEKEHFKVKPTNLSAVVLSVGAQGMSYVTATLRDPEGQPIVHKVAYIKALSKTEHIMVFTDDKGFTVVEGLSAGEYQILLPGTVELTATFKVPNDTQGKLLLGSLILSEANK